MASEIRVDKINSLSGVGTVTLSPTGVDIAGITTAATLRATTGIVTSLTAVSSAKVGSGVTLSPDGDIFATGVTTSTTFVGNLTGDVTGSASQITVADESSDTDAFLVFTNTATGNNAPKTGTNLTFNSSNGSLGVGGAVNLTDTSTGTGTNGGIYRHSNGYTYYQPKSDGNGGILSNGDGTATWRTHSPGGSNGYLTAEVGNGTQRLLLDSNGYLGLHITDPHLYYSKTLVVGAETEGDGGGITIKGSSSHTNYLMFADSNSGAARYDGYIGYSHNAQELYLAAAGASRAKISSNGNLTIGNGNIIIGTAGKGIDFSATTDATGTMSSELFDDYEEGSWTPVYEGTTTTGTVSYAAQIGKYVKIGKVVFWEFYMNFNNGNGAGLVHISGLPFTTASNSTYPAVNIGYVHNHTLRSDHILTGLHANSSNYLYFYERPNGGGTNVQLNYDGSGSLIMSGHYQAG